MPRERDASAREGGQGQTRAREGVAPMYRQLPRGPHSLDPREIERHQRARIQGAMVEAVARTGYDGVTVRQVIGLAGVSRRSFYEQFANRHDCFLKTARAIARSELRRAGEACAAEQRPPEGSLTAAFAVLAASAREQPASMRLVLSDSLTSGDRGAVLLGDVLGACEGMLAPALALGREAPPPGPILRALVGALQGMVVASLREEHADSRELAAELSGTALAVRLPARTGAMQQLTSSLRDRARRAGLAASARPAPPDGGLEGPRERMLRSAMRLSADQPVARLSAPQIADGAGVPIDDYLEEFPHRGQCLEEALEWSGERLLTIARRAEEVAADWPQAVRLALAGLLGHLAANPPQARALAFVAHRAGTRARARAVESDAALGEALTRGGPRRRWDAEAAAGALWHTVRQALSEDRARLLPACSDHLAYTLLAPAVGAEAALTALRGPC